MPHNFCLLLLFLAQVSVFAEDPFIAQRKLWQADISEDTWWQGMKDLGDPTPMVLPPGDPTPPKKVLWDSFHYAELKTFLEYPLNNHRNMIRLLGKPAQVSFLQNGQCQMEWPAHTCVLIIPSKEEDRTFDVRYYDVSVIISSYQKFTWHFRPVEKPVKPPALVNDDA